jgi:hypothetical protein
MAAPFEQAAQERLPADAIAWINDNIVGGSQPGAVPVGGSPPS